MKRVTIGWAALSVGIAAGMLLSTTAMARKATKSVELIVPAGTGGADQVARLFQAIARTHNLMKQPLVVVNKSGGAGAEGFPAMKDAKGDPHKIVITLSNLFPAPLATGVPFEWKDLTPVSIPALDQFVLRVNAESPHSTAKEYAAAVEAAGPRKFKTGAAGSEQEDRTITVALDKAEAPHTDLMKEAGFLTSKGGK